MFAAESRFDRRAVSPERLFVRADGGYHDLVRVFDLLA